MFYPFNEVLEYPKSVIEAWDFLISKGASINHNTGKNTTRNTLLMNIAYRPIAGKSELVKYLISKGADLYQIRDENGLCGYDWLKREKMDWVVE